MTSELRAELDSKRHAIVALCEKYGVQSLDLFGSAVRDDWGPPEESDLDFIVAFRPQKGHGLADRYLGLARDLERLFGRRVDLLTERAIRNPFFRRSIEADRAAVYAA